MPIPIEKIIEAADKAGFATELRAAAILANNGWSVHENVYFIDKDEGKGRELDIRASRSFLNKDEEPVVSCRIFLCIEIKKTADPFIFYSNKKRRIDGSAGYGFAHWRHNVNRLVLSFKDIERRRPLARAERIARSYSSFKTGQTQHILSGVISAFKAAIHERDRCDERYNDHSGDICFFVPMVVVDGPLYECFFEEGDDVLSAREIDEIQYLQNYHSEKYGRWSHTVHIMSLAAFASRLPHYADWGQDMLNSMVGNRENVGASDDS